MVSTCNSTVRILHESFPRRPVHFTLVPISDAAAVVVVAAATAATVGAVGAVGAAGAAVTAEPVLV